MSNIREIENEKKTNLLTNIINNWIKENNSITDKTKNIKYQNVSDWPKRSPFEFYNKNLIIPNNSVIQKNSAFKKTQKLKEINDDINQIITKNKNEKNSNVKVSLLSQNKKTKSGSITIKPLSNKENKEDKTIDNINNNISRKNYEEKGILYDFGYTKEERLEPLKLSLNKKEVISDNKDLESKNKNNEDNLYILTFEKKENKDGNLTIKQNEIQENMNINKEKIKKENQILIVPKSEKEIKYYKDKDLFDEEVKENDLDVTNDQMDILESITHKGYNVYNRIYKQKHFETIHPYLEKGYYKRKYKDNYENDYKKQERVYNMLQKQKIIINNIMQRKYNLYYNINNNYTNSNNKIKLLRSKSSMNEYNLYPQQHKKYFRSYSTNEYYNDNNWEKRQEMFERKKEYSIIVLLNERRNIEERKNARIIKRIRLNEEGKQIEKMKSDDDEEEEEKYDYENENDYYENSNKLPEIKQRKMKEEIDNEEYLYNKKKVYTNSYNPLRKYRLKKMTKKELLIL